MRLFGYAKSADSAASKRRLFGTILIAVVFLSGIAFGADWEMRVTDGAALEISHSKVPIVKADYCFWGSSWSWAAVKARIGEPKGGDKAFSGDVSALGLRFDGTVRSLAPNKARYTWNIEADRNLRDIIGGGLEFRLVGDSPSLGSDVSDPVLLANNTGWRWDVSDKGPIVVEFDRPCASVYFERGNKNQIRAMFVGQDLAKGSYTFSMAVTLPAGGALVKTLAERYGPADTSKWYSGALLHDKSPVDLSFLNHKPAGRFGFVRAEGDKLVFENGQQVRFWGGNIAAYAIFADREHIRTQAKRIAQLGYNLMRIHHHDSMGWVGRTVIEDKSRADSQHLDAEVMDRLDYWIKCLRDEGVYIWLDLHVGRLFKAGDRIGAGFAEMQRRSKRDGAEGKGFCYFNERIEQLMKDFNAKYMTHVNRYTSLAYKDDPAIMGL
ncbi:MAG: cellulase family glycosylhydrolase, partial [Phycisphaerales bacterium]